MFSSSEFPINHHRLAIVVPAYGVEKYLKECLDSLLAQTHRNFVIFAVDDGSPDESGKILDEYAKRDSRITVIHKENGGLSSARNAALNAIEQDGKFDYIGFVDSDDKVLPVYLENLVNAINNNDADIAQCGYFKFNDNGKIKKKNTTAPHKTLSNEEFIECIFSTLNVKKSHFTCGYVWNKLFSASLIRGLRFPHDREVLEDEIFSLQATLKAKKVAYLPDVLYGYRQRSNSIVRNERFARQRFEGRLLCLDAAKGMSDHAAIVVASSIAVAAVKLLDDAKTVPTLNLKPYRNLVLEAEKLGLVEHKVVRGFLLFCEYPILARAYRDVRRLLRTLSFWKKNKKELAINLT